MLVIRPWDGKPIREAGIYSGVPIDFYHSARCCAPDVKISSSGLKRMFLDSPAHYWDQSPYNPKRAEDKGDSEAKRRGSAAHAVLIGSEIFSERYIIRPESLLNPETKKMRKWDGRNAECKTWLAAVPRGKTVLTPDDAEAVRGMALRLGQTPIVTQGLLNGLIELSLFWEDFETGIWLSARPDVFDESGHHTDLKTARSTNYGAMQSALLDYGYAQQAALVAEGCRALGVPFETFTFCFVENERPYCVATEQIKDDAIEKGRLMNRAALHRFAECIEKYGMDADSVWPGPRGEQHDVEYIDFSERQRAFIDDRLKFEFGEAA